MQNNKGLTFIFKVILSVLIWLAAAAPAQAADGFSPWDFSRPAASSVSKNHAGTTDPASPPARALEGAFRLFRDYVSAVDGDRCSMYPTCSQYAVEAVRKHGFFAGWLMAADRLIHEWDESGLAPQVVTDKETRSYDPVSSNDFWWHKK